MNLVGVDWGTSSLRAARIGADGRATEERQATRGILTVPAGDFPAALQATCGDWLAAPDTLCLVSGMAGSRQGWHEAPYCPCPAGFAELTRALAWIAPGRIAIVPGLSCEHDGVPDVMRGEEVQVFGALALQGGDPGLFVLPGTHSKWVRVEAGRVAGFTTCMSGEVYGLLRQHSILARTLPAADGALQREAFLQGVRQAGRQGSLLASAFSARTLALFGRMEGEALASYLSGLVIGEELRLYAADGLASADPVVLVGSPALTQRYQLGLAEFGINAACLGAEATWRGLRAIADALENR